MHLQTHQGRKREILRFCYEVKTYFGFSVCLICTPYSFKKFSLCVLKLEIIWQDKDVILKELVFGTYAFGLRYHLFHFLAMFLKQISHLASLSYSYPFCEMEMEILNLLVLWLWFFNQQKWLFIDLQSFFLSLF